MWKLSKGELSSEQDVFMELAFDEADANCNLIMDADEVTSAMESLGEVGCVADEDSNTTATCDASSGRYDRLDIHDDDIVRYLEYREAMERWFVLTDDTETLAVDPSAYLQQDFVNRDRDRFVRERQQFNEAVFIKMTEQMTAAHDLKIANFKADFTAAEVEAFMAAVAVSATAAPATNSTRRI